MSNRVGSQALWREANALARVTWVRESFGSFEG